MGLARPVLHAPFEYEVRDYLIQAHRVPGAPSLGTGASIQELAARAGQLR